MSSHAVASLRCGSMNGMDEERQYRKKMAFIVLGVSLSIPLLLVALLLLLDYFFNPFREW
jgi:hypothetical protein